MFQADKKWRVLIKWLPKDWFKEFRSMYNRSRESTMVKC